MQHHIGHLIRDTPKDYKIFMSLDQEKLDQLIQYCLDILDIMVVKYPTLHEVLDIYKTWHSEELQGSTDDGMLVVGTAYLGDFAKARRLLASGRKRIEERAKRGLADLSQQGPELDRCEKIIDRLEAEAAKTT